MQTSGGCQALTFQSLPHSHPLPAQYLRSLISSSTKPETINSVVAASVAAAGTAQIAFDFWTEDENARFIRALDSERYPPDYSVIAAKVGGNRTAEQCTSYTHLYFEALAQKRRLEEAAGRPAGLHLTALEVYTYHGVGPFYDDVQKKQRLEGGGESGEAAGGCERQSISCLRAPTVAGAKLEDDACPLGSGPSTKALTPPRVAAKEEDAEEEWGGKGRAKEAKERKGTGSKGPVKRKREADRSVEDVEREIDAGRVPHEELWSYSAMREGVPEASSAGRRNKGKNPWLWTRKVICKVTGYQQWWPLFSDHVHLTERESKDDLKVIRTKAPPPTVAELCNPYSRKFDKKVAAAALAAKKGKGDAPEGSPGKSIKAKLQVGDFVEVKWGVDWWHAQIVQIGKANRTTKVLVGYVGGTEDEEEWVEISRVREPQEDVRDVLAGKGGMR